MTHAYKIVDRKRLNVQLYNQLLEATPEASIYNHLDYIDYLADQSQFLIFGDYQGVLPLPFTKRLNSKCLTNPVFSRLQDWLGDKPENFSNVVELLKTHFDRCDFSIGNIQWDGTDAKSKVTQTIGIEQDIVLNTQAKRNLKKLQDLPYTIEEVDKEEALNPINQLLLFKIGGVRDIEVTRFNRLIHFFDHPNFVTKGLKLNGEWLAIGVFIQWRGQYLYIKGTNTSQGQEFAAMQTLIMHEIQWAKENQLTFQFEGSNVESVARFNHSFGAKDETYLNLNWDHSKGMFAFLKKWLKR